MYLSQAFNILKKYYDIVCALGILLFVMVEQPERFTISEGLRIAGECFEEGKYNRSFQIYSEIIKVKPDNLIACKRLALINESYGRHEEALSFYKRIISLFPVDVEFIASYIRLLIKTGNISGTSNA